MITNEDIDEEIFDRDVDQELSERSLEEFCRSAWPIIEPGTELKWNWHLSTICGYLEAFHRGDIERRLIINIPPGTLKSILVSVMYPTWVWISSPDKRFLTVTNEQGLAIRDALRMKQIITSEWFQSKWPLALQSDQNEKTLFANERRGHRQSQGITGATTGKRGDYLVIDDPIDAKHAFSDVIRQSVNDTYDQTLSTRLNDPNESGVLLIMQRLHEADLSGHLLKKTKTNWTNLTIPMRFENKPTFDAGKDIGKSGLNDPREKKGELLFPERFNKQKVEALEEDLGEYGFAGQMQQRPVPSGGGIIKSHWWRMWPDDKKPPVCEHVFLSYDTAFSEKDMKNAAYSAMTRWGIFWNEERDRNCLICLGAWYGRVGYDELRAKAKQFEKDYEPDTHLIEKKATGISLIQDMRRAIPGKVRSYSPGKGEDKVSRANSVSPMFSSGLIYIPNKPWARAQSDNAPDGLVEFIAKFPTGEPPSADLCFIAGTMIATNRGSIPIEQVSTNDMVLTTRGFKSVVHFGLTGCREVVDNINLTGTNNHPIFTFNKGYTNLDTVTQADQLLRLNVCDLIKITYLEKLNLMDINSIEYQKKVNISLEELRTGGLLVCILQYGKSITVGKLKKDMTLTILMVIAITTILKTLSLYRIVCIEQYLKKALIRKRIRGCLIGLDRLLRNGIDLKKGGNGIERTQRLVSVQKKTENYLTKTDKKSKGLSRAIGAVTNSSTEASVKSFVQQIAKARKVDGDAEKQALLTNTLVPVYNLTVDDAHCYFANDILVHNCDTVTQACIYLRSGSWVQHPDDEDFDEDIKKGKRKAAYG